jgi:hypothetical protein
VRAREDRRAVQLTEAEAGLQRIMPSHREQGEIARDCAEAESGRALSPGGPSNSRAEPDTFPMEVGRQF